MTLFLQKRVSEATRREFEEAFGGDENYYDALDEQDWFEHERIMT